MATAHCASTHRGIPAGPRRTRALNLSLTVCSCGTARLGSILFGLKLLTVSTVHLGFSSSTLAMVLARIGMGVGDSLIGATLGWHDNCSSEAYAAKLGAAFGIGFGPLFGGLLLQYSSHRTVFFSFSVIVAFLGFTMSMASPSLAASDVLRGWAKQDAELLRVRSTCVQPELSPRC